MKRFLPGVLLLLVISTTRSAALSGQEHRWQVADLAYWQANLTEPQDYVLKRISSADPTGGNADDRPIEPGGTLTILDADGPGVLTHIWFTLWTPEP